MRKERLPSAVIAGSWQQGQRSYCNNLLIKTLSTVYGPTSTIQFVWALQFSANNASTDLNHSRKLKLKLHKTVLIGINRLGNKVYLLERFEFWQDVWPLRKSWWSVTGVLPQLRMISWGADAPRGKTCHLIDFIDTAYKPHYRGRMIKLMQTVIEHTCDPNHDCTEDTERVKNLKNEMDYVRSLKNNPWPDLTSMFIYSKEPVCITTREILDMMTERRDHMGIHEVLCLCTCVTDLCSSLVAKNFESVISEIIESQVNFILHKNVLAVRDFLFWLDHCV